MTTDLLSGPFTWRDLVIAAPSVAVCLALATAIVVAVVSGRRRL